MRDSLDDVRQEQFDPLRYLELVAVLLVDDLLEDLVGQLLRLSHRHGLLHRFQLVFDRHLWLLYDVCQTLHNA